MTMLDSVFEVGDRIIMLESYWEDNLGKSGTVIRLTPSVLDESSMITWILIDDDDQVRPMATSVMRHARLN